MIDQFIKTRNILALCKLFFPTHPLVSRLTPTQQDIIRKIVFREYRKISIAAYTRFGKTLSVAIAVCLLILLNDNKKVAIIAPAKHQAEILRNYISELIVCSPILTSLVAFEAEGAEKLKRETSKTRVTFRNGCEYRIHSAHNPYSLMGHGANIVLVDEAGLIDDRETYTKIMRMLGDDPKNAMLIEIYNPFSKDTKVFDHSINPDFHVMSIPYSVGIKEGILTSDFIEDMRGEITPLEFQVLYEARFPDEEQDQLIRYLRIVNATDKEYEFNNPTIIMGVDVADKGMDATVITIARWDGNFLKVFHIYSENKSETTTLCGTILSLQEKFTVEEIHIDTIGIGVGLVSLVKERIAMRRCKIIGCHYGESAYDSRRFQNKKAEAFFFVKKLFEEGRISIPKNQYLISQLSAMKWEYSSSQKIKIIDPEKSPDFADSLVYTCWYLGHAQNTYTIVPIKSR